MNGFGSDKKNVVKGSCTPGPGSFSYDKNEAWTNKTCENWTFGSSKRSDSLPPTEIGPG